ncbi:hypothetical protein [Methanospirillum lacunae]|uniref:Uncharacterized protein n=2 Tax=Methanospirillum lacunae TaxID=668570 RepID=A0A2V2N5A7_9EURY|nr:hypothetical protein [Methanospirillum lacunae]PWR73780.1 hypothetical protein DK846_01015 [Methanospirillum lacunae]
MQGPTQPDIWITPVFHPASSLHSSLQQTRGTEFFAVLPQVTDIMADEITPTGDKYLQPSFLPVTS